MLSLFVILSLSPIPPNTETMMIYNSKKKGEKEKKIHGRGSKPGDATNTRVSPFTTSLQAFASFLFYQLQSLHIPLSIGACSCEEVEHEDLTLC
jgi:hypothetical protein